MVMEGAMTASEVFSNWQSDDYLRCTCLCKMQPNLLAWLLTFYLDSKLDFLQHPDFFMSQAEIWRYDI